MLRPGSTSRVVVLILCALGIYTAYAMVLEAELRLPVLPLGGRRPIHGEPGVREEL